MAVSTRNLWTAACVLLLVRHSLERTIRIPRTPTNLPLPPSLAPGDVYPDFQGVGIVSTHPASAVVDQTQPSDLNVTLANGAEFTLPDYANQTFTYDDCSGSELSPSLLVRVGQQAVPALPVAYYDASQASGDITNDGSAPNIQFAIRSYIQGAYVDLISGVIFKAGEDVIYYVQNDTISLSQPFAIGNKVADPGTTLVLPVLGPTGLAWSLVYAFQERAFPGFPTATFMRGDLGPRSPGQVYAESLARLYFNVASAQLGRSPCHPGYPELEPVRAFLQGKLQEIAGPEFAGMPLTEYLVNDDAGHLCLAERNASYHASVLVEGARHLQPSAAACCASCRTYVPRLRANATTSMNATAQPCNVWTYCGERGGCQAGAERHVYGECALKYSKVAAEAAPLGRIEGTGDDPSGGTLRGADVTLISGRTAPTLPWMLNSVLVPNTTYITPTSSELDSGTVNPARIQNIVRGEFWHKKGVRTAPPASQLQYLQLLAAGAPAPG